MKSKFLLLGVIYLCFIVIGAADSTLGTAWAGIRADMGFDLEFGGILSTTAVLFYSLSTSLLGKLSKFAKTSTLTLIGLIFLITAFVGFFFAPNFIFLVFMTFLSGTGSGLIDSSINSYTAKHFSSRVMNWLNCFWGMGASISPIIVSIAIENGNWRYGYAVLFSFFAVAAVIVSISKAKKLWKYAVDEEETSHADEINEPKNYLTKKIFQYLHMAIFFVYMSLEGILGFWIVSVMIESRDLTMSEAALYPSIYFAFTMVGRFIFGMLSKYLSNVTMVRIGLILSIIGVVILFFVTSPIIIALIGFGFAPVFPCLMHETNKRFSPDILERQVGFQLSVGGIGIAIVSPLVGLVLSRIWLEALFPIAFVLVVVTFALNEYIEGKARKGETA